MIGFVRIIQILMVYNVISFSHQFPDETTLGVRQKIILLLGQSLDVKDQHFEIWCRMEGSHGSVVCKYIKKGTMCFTGGTFIK
jgi:hypothetical protein